MPANNDLLSNTRANMDVELGYFDPLPRRSTKNLNTMVRLAAISTLLVWRHGAANPGPVLRVGALGNRLLILRHTCSRSR